MEQAPMTIYNAREERAQLPLSCAAVSKRSQKDSGTQPYALLSVGLLCLRAVSPIIEQQGLVMSFLQVCKQLLMLPALQKRPAAQSTYPFALNSIKKINPSICLRRLFTFLPVVLLWLLYTEAEGCFLWIPCAGRISWSLCLWSMTA